MIHSIGGRRQVAVRWMLVTACTALLLAATTLGSPSDAAAVTSTATSTATPGERPNVVVVLTDDMRADDLEHLPLTRSLMEAGGMSFTDAISPHPLCCPARAELLTGQYAQNNGVQHNTGRYGGFQRFDGSRTIATWFARAGYRNAFIGKYVNLYSQRHRAEPGWHAWHALTRGVTDYFDFGFHDGSTYRRDYVTTRIEERTNQAVRDAVDLGRPFLVYANHVAPHDRQSARHGTTFAPAERQFARHASSLRAPSLASPAFNRTTRGGLPRIMRAPLKSTGYEVKHSRGYYQAKWLARIRSLQSVDRAVASLFATLAETGQADNTYVVFTSDNGYNLGEHKLYRKNLPTRESLRVPLLVTGPGITPGSTSPLPVTLVDLVPTLTGLAGAVPDLRLDGTSFAPTLHGQAQEWRDTTLVQTGSEKTGVRHPGWGVRGVRTERYTYVRDVNTGERLLYDRQRDPREGRNAARDPRYAQTVRVLDQRTTALLRCAGSACNRRFGPVPAPR